jgi:hypothetical protein
VTVLHNQALNDQPRLFLIGGREEDRFLVAARASGGEAAALRLFRPAP